MSLLDTAAIVTTNGEGYRQDPYKDTKGIWTWGVGRNLEANPITADEWAKITAASKTLRERPQPMPNLAQTLTILSPKNGFISEQFAHDFARDYLMRELQRVSSIMSKESPFFDKLSDQRKVVLIDMGYNMGPRFWNDWPNFTKQLSTEDFMSASKNMLTTLWAQQVGSNPPSPMNPRGQRAWYLSVTMATNILPSWANTEI